jgi:3-dehydroquinate dehydratase/shikimate dehydrogenase
MREARSRLTSLRRKADLVEIRIDGLVNAGFRSLLRRPRPPVIITNRGTAEGGKFSGTAARQAEVLMEAARHGAEFVDIEASRGAVWIDRLKSAGQRARVIASYHNFRETPRNISTIYDRIRELGADIIKVAVTARDIADNRRIFDLCERAAAEGQPLIALCMGERGEASRILGNRFGAFLTYGSQHEDDGTAPGQRTIDDLRRLFRVGAIDRRSRIFGLAGNPVSFSRGIYYHNAAFRRAGANAVYVNFLVDNVESFLESLGPLLTGCSVTMPWKEPIIPLLDRVDPPAREAGTVNTVIRKKNSYIGYNTDIRAVTDLLARHMRMAGKRVTVLGTGGTARAMAYAAIAGGARVTIAGRSRTRAAELARELGAASAHIAELADIACDVVMNATPVGSAALGTGESPVGPGLLRKGMTVFDAVYTPPSTQLLAQARRAGCRTISGTELFNLQAKYQSEIFFRCMQ